MIIIESYYQEYATRANPDGIVANGIGGLNAIAKDLAGFVNSVKNNGGYYIARYEASYGSGSSVADYKPLSKVSTSTSFSTSKVGSLWYYVTQIEASKISRNMYKNDNNVGVESDLVNSYAYDTAIVFIQEMGNTNYANKTSVNSTLKNTGTIGDKVCNIHDISSNCKEWSTEYSMYEDRIGVQIVPWPCVSTGGSCYNSSLFTMRRQSVVMQVNDDGTHSFRTIIYIK